VTRHTPQVNPSTVIATFGCPRSWRQPWALALESGFFVLSFGDLGEPNTAYVEHAIGAAHLGKEPHVTLARLEFDRLRTLALAPAESQDVIRRVAGES
jgi:hypothetical protein